MRGGQRPGAGDVNLHEVLAPELSKFLTSHIFRHGSVTGSYDCKQETKLWSAQVSRRRKYGIAVDASMSVCTD